MGSHYYTEPGFFSLKQTPKVVYVYIHTSAAPICSFDSEEGFVKTSVFLPVSLNCVLL